VSDGDVKYTDAILRDVLTRGIADAEIQLDLIGDQKQDMPLEEVFQFVEAKEAGKRSASRLIDSHSVETASSTFQRSNLEKLPKQRQFQRKVTAKVPQHVYVRQRDQPTDTHATSVIVIITWNMYVGARTNRKSKKMTLWRCSI